MIFYKIECKITFFYCFRNTKTLVAAAVPRRYLCQQEVAQGLEMLEAGVSRLRVAQLISLSHHVISRGKRIHEKTDLIGERLRSCRAAANN